MWIFYFLEKILQLKEVKKILNTSIRNIQNNIETEEDWEIILLSLEKLVKSLIYKEFYQFSYVIEDLIQQSKMVIIENINKFNAEYSKFFTFAYILVKRTIIKAVTSIIKHNTVEIDEKYNNKLNYSDEMKIEDKIILDIIIKNSKEYLTTMEWKIINEWRKGKTSIELSKELKISRQRINFLKKNIITKIREKEKICQDLKGGI